VAEQTTTSFYADNDDRVWDDGEVLTVRERWQDGVIQADDNDEVGVV
jgi:hypothetical protein